MSKRLTETTPLSEAGTGTSGRMKVHAISAGVGSSGYYSPDVLREAATNELIKTGTPLFLDHPSESDRQDRPERSVRDIAAVFTEAATFDDAAQALVGEIQVFAPYRELLSEMAPHIGLSISGSATDITEGDVDGRRVPIVEGLHAIDSVDFVTRAGRGGKVVELLESVRVNKRALEHAGITEATVNDTREALQQVLRDTYGAEKTYVWVRDFDDLTVWFEVESGNDSGIFGQGYTANDGAVALAGDRSEVRVVTSYVPVGQPATTENALLSENEQLRRQVKETTHLLTVQRDRIAALEKHTHVPVTRPDSTNPTTEADQEVTMGNIQIEESEHRALVEKAGRVDALEAERDTEKARAEKAELAVAERDRRDAARKIISERATAADMLFTPLEERGLLADLPLKENDLDVEAFTKSVDEAAAARKAAGGFGAVTGFGGQPAGGGESTISEADLDAKVGAAFGRQVKEA